MDGGGGDSRDDDDEPVERRVEDVVDVGGCGDLAHWAKFSSGTCSSNGCRVATNTECFNATGSCDHSGCLEGCTSYFWSGNAYFKYVM